MASIFDRFTEGARCVMQRWTALAMAVEMNWGGGNGAQKAEGLFEEVLAFLRRKPRADPRELQELLDELVEDTFCMVLEDQSSAEVARLLLQLVGECFQRDFSTVDRLVAEQAALPRPPVLLVDGAVEAAEGRRGPESDSDSGSESGEPGGPEGPEGSEGESDGEGSDGEEGEGEGEGEDGAGPEVDEPEAGAAAAEDDGWETVQTTRRGGRRR